MAKDLKYEPNPFFNIVEEKTNKDNMEIFLGNLYWQRKTAEAIASQKIAEAELEIAQNIIDGTAPKGTDFALSNNAKQALNNQTMYSYLKAVDRSLGVSSTEGDISRKIFSGDDR